MIKDMPRLDDSSEEEDDGSEKRDGFDSQKEMAKSRPSGSPPSSIKKKRRLKRDSSFDRQFSNSSSPFRSQTDMSSSLKQALNSRLSVMTKMNKGTSEFPS